MAQAQLQKLQKINELRKKLSSQQSTLKGLQTEAERMESVLEKDLKDFYDQLTKEYRNAANMTALEEDLKEYSSTEQETLNGMRESIAKTVDAYLEKHLGELVESLAKKHNGSIHAGSVAKKVLPSTATVQSESSLKDTDLRVVTKEKDYILDIPLLRSTLIQKVIQQNAA